MEKPTRGRASKIDLLPPTIKTQLAMMLRDKQYSQAEILQEINDLIIDCGLDESMQLSRTGLNRYASRMEKMASKIRHGREVAEVWTKQLGEQPQSDIGKLLMEFIKNMAFETSLDMSEGKLDASPEALGQLSLVIQRIERAQAISDKRERDIRKEVAQQAAATAEKAVAQAGLSKETVDNIKSQILGLA